MKIPIKYAGNTVLVVEVDDRTGVIRTAEPRGDMGQRVVDYLSASREFQFGDSLFATGTAFAGAAFLQQFLLQLWELDRGLTYVMDRKKYFDLPSTPREARLLGE